MRSSPNSLPELKKAITNSVVVATFGTGVEAVDIRRITTGGTAAAQKSAVATAEQASRVGTQLVGNPGLHVSSGDRNLLTGGRVDLRIPLALGSQLATGTVTVAGFPIMVGEGSAPRRAVEIVSLNGSPAISGGSLTKNARAFIVGLSGDYAPQSVSVQKGTMQLVYSAAASTGLAQ